MVISRSLQEETSLLAETARTEREDEERALARKTLFLKNI
jgi:hypothetical protein